MIPSHRQWFNESWTREKYRRFLQMTQERTGTAPRFRHAETPCFFPPHLIDTAARCGREIVEQLLSNDRYLRDSAEAIPPEYRVPNDAPVPLFVQADFGLDQDLQPKLVEIQGFPSLYAYQPLLSECYREAFAIDSHVEDTVPADYYTLLRRAILGEHDPAEVVLLEVNPEHQKTWCDFAMTEKLFGVRTVDIAAVRKSGSRLFAGDVPIRRIYNRAIVDEIRRKDVKLQFDWRDELDVEWAGHPNWFFRLSKFSLPYLEHPAVPKTIFAGPVADPENWVLKPLYSFAGLGVVVAPSAEQIAAASPEEFILQERVEFQPVIETPAGAAKVELRIMYIWLEELRPVNVIVRMGRGEQMGVDHNQGFEWVGASAAFVGR